MRHALWNASPVGVGSGRVDSGSARPASFWLASLPLPWPRLWRLELKILSVHADLRLGLGLGVKPKAQLGLAFGLG